MEKEPFPLGKVTPESDPEEVLLGRALAGDAEAAHWLVSLLESQHRDRITGRMKSLHTGAHTQTIEDVFQDTILRLLGRLKAGELKDLPPDDRQNIQHFFQRLCDGSLRDEVRARKSPVLARKKEEVPEGVIDVNAPIPGDSRHTEHLALIDDAIKRLDPEHARVIRMYHDGKSHEEIGRETGLTLPAVRNQINRIKLALRDDIVQRSMTAKLNFESEKAKAKPWPTKSEIETAVAALPPEIKEAATFVHIERRSTDDLARKLGDRGCEKAQARLKQAYRSLSGRLKVPFPEAFEKGAP